MAFTLVPVALFVDARWVCWISRTTGQVHRLDRRTPDSLVYSGSPLCPGHSAAASFSSTLPFPPSENSVQLVLRLQSSSTLHDHLHESPVCPSGQKTRNPHLQRDHQLLILLVGMLNLRHYSGGTLGPIYYLSER